MNKYFALSMGGGFLSAALSLAAISGFPGGIMLALFSQLPLFAVGLGLGTPAVALACAGAAAILAGVGGILVAASFLATTALPVMLIVHLLLQSRTEADGTVEWYPPGFALSWLAALGVAFIAVLALWHAGAEGGIEGAGYRWIKQFFTMPAVADGQQRPAMLTAEQVDLLARRMARYLPAGVVMASMTVFIVNGALAQRLLVRAGHNLRPTVPLSELELPRWPTPALAVAAALSLIPGQIGMVAQNMLLVLAIPFLFLGLAVIHAYARRWQGRGFALAVLYLALIFLQWPALIVAGLGFVEQWAQLRGRLAARNSGQEEE